MLKQDGQQKLANIKMKMVLENVKPGIPLCRRKDLKGVAPTPEDPYILKPIDTRPLKGPPKASRSAKGRGAKMIFLSTKEGMSRFRAVLRRAYQLLEEGRKVEWHVRHFKKESKGEEEFYAAIADSPHLWHNVILKAMPENAYILIPPQTNFSEYCWVTSTVRKGRPMRNLALRIKKQRQIQREYLINTADPTSATHSWKATILNNLTLNSKGHIEARPIEPKSGRQLNTTHGEAAKTRHEAAMHGSFPRNWRGEKFEQSISNTNFVNEVERQREKAFPDKQPNKDENSSEDQEPKTEAHKAEKHSRPHQWPERLSILKPTAEDFSGGNSVAPIGRTEALISRLRPRPRPLIQRTGRGDIRIGSRYLLAGQDLPEHNELPKGHLQPARKLPSDHDEVAEHHTQPARKRNNKAEDDSPEDLDAEVARVLAKAAQKA